MSHCWPEAIAFREIPLVSETRICRACGGVSRISKHRKRRLYTLDGPVCLILKRLRCANEDCSLSGTFAPEQELDYALPRWLIGWDVFCWVGHRRFARHWAISQIRNELEDSYGIRLSDDALEDDTDQYQTMVAAYWQDRKQLDEPYADTNEVILSIDGLQPEKGHETLYVVRELTHRRVLFALTVAFQRYRGNSTLDCSSQRTCSNDEQTSRVVDVRQAGCVRQVYCG
jgi:hypothetical protein